MDRNPYLVNRAFKSYLVATIMSTMAVSFGSMLGSIVVGQVLGSDALGAVNVMMPVIQMFAALNALINIGGATVMAVYVGKGKASEISGIFTKCLVASAVISVLLAVSGALLIDPIIDILCTSDALREHAREYGILVFAMSPLYILMPGIGTFVRMDNAPNLATFGFLTTNTVMLVLAYVFTGPLDMGLTGYALSTAIGYISGLIVLSKHFIGGNSRLSIGKGSVRLTEILYMGSPASFAMILIMVNMLGMNVLVMNNLGSDGMAIRSVCLNIQMLSSVFVSGISQTLQPVGGTLYGSEDMTGMRMVTGIAAKYQVAASGTIMLIAFIVPNLFLWIYGVNDPALMDDGMYYIRIFAPYILLQAVNYMIMILFQVFGHRPISLAISAMECVLILLLAYVLAPINHDFIWASFWMGEAITLVTVIIISLFVRRYRPEFSGLALLRKPEGYTADFSLRGDGTGLKETLDRIQSFTEENGIESGISLRARLCAEEILLNVVDHGLSHNPDRYIDILIRIDKGNVKMTVRDDGEIFDPITYDSKGTGLLIVMGQCDSLNYARSVNQNNVFIGFNASQ